MSASNFSGNANNLLPQTYIIPEDPDEKDLKIRQYFNDLATATNTKDSGIYDAVETITGQSFLPTFSTLTPPVEVELLTLEKLTLFLFAFSQLFL